MKLNKIKKLNEDVMLEANTADQEIVDFGKIEKEMTNAEPVSDISDVDKLATEIQKNGLAATGGEKTYSDSTALDVAKMVANLGLDADVSEWAPLALKNKLTASLDRALSNSIDHAYTGTKAGTNVLVDGLPGSGKTAIVRSWAESRGVNFLYINAKDNDLDAKLNGIVGLQTDDKGMTSAVRAKVTGFLEKLSQPNLVLFFDEFNRAPGVLRAMLLTLINEHALEGYGPETKDGYKYYDNILFSIACINPHSVYDETADDLNEAELSRYADKITWDSNRLDALAYLKFALVKKTLTRLQVGNNRFESLWKKTCTQLAIALKLLGSKDFHFDSREDLDELGDQKKTMLNQRLITDGILNSSSLQDFISWVDGSSSAYASRADLLDKDVDMIKAILSGFEIPTIVVPKTDKEKAEIINKLVTVNHIDDLEDVLKDKNADNNTDSDDNIDNTTELDPDAFSGEDPDAGTYDQSTSTGQTNADKLAKFKF